MGHDIHSAPSHSAVLTSWKEVANYLGKGVRTVQRYERRFGLPVRRPAGSSTGKMILVTRADLDAWIASRWSNRDPVETQASLRPTNSDQVKKQLVSQIKTAKQLLSANAALLSKITQTLQALKSVAEMQKLPAPKDGDDLPGKLRIPEAKRSHPAAMRTA